MAKLNFLQPIWKDHFFDLGPNDGDTYPFRIMLMPEEKVIYEGIGIGRPGQDSVKVRINDICADYIGGPFPSIREVFTEEKINTFMLAQYDLTDEDWLYYDEVQLYPNWSYEEGFDPIKKGLSCPITGRITTTTPFPYTTFNAQELELELLPSGLITYLFPPKEIMDGTYMVVLDDLDFGTDIYQYKDTSVEVTDMNNHDYTTYHIVNGCYRYALYYRNAYGGVDVFLIEGNHKEVDSLTRHTREVEYDNSDVMNRGRQNYVNEISKSLILHTSWLTDEEASRMHHLLNSNEVYLYDIPNEKMIPVILKNTTTEYKTYKSNGCKLVDYAIEVEFANKRVRR